MRVDNECPKFGCVFMTTIWFWWSSCTQDWGSGRVDSLVLEGPKSIGKWPIWGINFCHKQYKIILLGQCFLTTQLLNLFWDYIFTYTHTTEKVFSHRSNGN